ncbi:MAG: TAT-variant-translocated molybdopterin oxidoreductase, partial [Bacteroidales bacterium]|nr:TAT-variant-translocated molybdopterin oxidoreductase [Bacteroidales bacterium]
MKKYWKSLEEQQGQSPRILEERYEDEHKSAVQELLNEDLGQSATSRRNFLKLAGFSVATAAIAASCENPVKKAIPYLNQPHEVVPGKANYYASTYFDGSDYCPVVVKVRDGRPIKLEGNELSGITGGGTNARVQAGVISLYDARARRRGPKASGEEVDWKVIDEVMKQELGRISTEGGRMVLLTSTIISPSTKRLLNEFIQQYPGFELVQYDPVAYTGMLAANQACFGNYSLPSYHFDKADLILSFGADFLGTWVSPVEFSHQYTS